MRWRPIQLSERAKNWLIAPIAVPLFTVAAVIFSPAILWLIADHHWAKHQRARGRHIWFAWHPVKFDAFWHDDVESCWFWLERVERRLNHKGWQYWPVGFVDPYETEA